jgi:hypothetical protein
MELDRLSVLVSRRGNLSSIGQTVSPKRHIKAEHETSKFFDIMTTIVVTEVQIRS